MATDWQGFARAVRQVANPGGPPAQAARATPSRVVWGKGVVTSVAPVRVQRGGESAPIPLDPIVLYSGAAVGDEVWLQVLEGAVVVYGKVY